MTQKKYDFVIVGARCAGATLATYLARAGASVVLVEKNKLPSEYVLSTHTIHPPGIDVLDEIGVGDAMREVTPPGKVIRVGKNGAFVDARYEEGRAEYCPRRERLDRLLQEAAVVAGAELLDQTRVTDLVKTNGHVAGVVAADPAGNQITLGARWVVGADGRHSAVARLVEAEEYLGYDAPRGMYWTYWSTPESHRESPEHPYGLLINHWHGHIRVLFRTDHDQLLLGTLPTVETARAWRSDAMSAYRTDLASDPVLGPITARAEPLEPVRGTLNERYYFRTGAGRGWALVGDAGHHKEFVIGDGMTEAFRQAKSLAPALLDGSERALAEWWRTRDVAAIELFRFGQDEGSVDPPLDLQHAIFSRLARDDALMMRLSSVFDRKTSAYDVLTPGRVLRYAFGAAIHGRLEVLPQFLAQGKRVTGVKRELAYRRKLLERAQAAH